LLAAVPFTDADIEALALTWGTHKLETQRAPTVLAWHAVVQTILTGLKQSDDENAQLTALTDLCEHLSISTEESLTTFPVEQVVPLLVRAPRNFRLLS